MERIRQFFLDQLAAESAEAVRHLSDSYWTDSRTGRNIGRDELEAVAAMQRIDLSPSPEEQANPALYRGRLLAELAAAGDRFRQEAIDADGYGIATIGTVARKLAAFADD